MRLASIALLITCGAANAEPSKLTVTAGGAVAATHLETEIDDVGFTAGLAIRLDAAYRVTSCLALGIHGGAMGASGRQHAYMQFYDYDFDYSGLELGATAQLVFDRLWVAPWIGISKLLGSADLEAAVHTSLGAGIAIGYGFYELPDGHYIDVFASATASAKDNLYYEAGYNSPTNAFVTFALGIDYRY